MDFLVNAVTWIQNHIALIGGYTGIGAGIAVVVQWVKVKFHLENRRIHWLKLDGKQLINILLTALTALPFAVETLLEQLGDGTNLSPNYAWLFVTAVWLHRFAVSPLYGTVKSKLEAEQQKDADAKAYRQLVATQKERTAPVNATRPTTPATTENYDPTVGV